MFIANNLHAKASSRSFLMILALFVISPFGILIDAQSTGISTVLWHSSQMFMASIIDNEVFVTDYDNQITIKVFEGNTNRVVNSIEWSDIGINLAIAVNDDIVIWKKEDNTTVTLPSYFDTRANQNNLLSLSDIEWCDDTIVARSGEIILVWNSLSQSFSKVIRGSWSSITDIDLTPNGLAISTYDGILYIVDLASGLEIQRFYVLDTKRNSIPSIKFSNDSNAIAMGWGDYDIFLWKFMLDERLDGSKPDLILSQSNSHLKPVTSLSWSPDNLYLATGSRDGTVKIWNAISGELIQTIEIGGVNTFVTVSWSPKGSRLAYIADNMDLPIVIQPNLPIADTLPSSP